MSRFCPHCGQPRPPGPVDGSPEPACPTCGRPAPLPTPSNDHAGLSQTEQAQTQALWLQSRRRTTLTLAAAILVLLGLLAWLLLHPSAPGSPARGLKNAVFGPRITEAVEQGRQGSEGGRSRDADARSHQNGRRTSQGSAQGSSTQGSAHGSAENNGGQGGSGQPGNGTPRDGAGSDLPSNEQLPDQAGPDLEAPPERSLGWLDRFFGADQTSGPMRPGEGGTGSLPGAGNDSPQSPNPPTNVVASERTSPDPAPEMPLDPNAPPPEPTRSTRRTNAPSNSLTFDAFETQLRQHHAGTGDVRISLMWANRNDLDLHVVDPSGREINYQQRRSTTGGVLDIDMNAGVPLRSPAVENIFWPERGAPAGVYQVFVNHFRKHDRPDVTPFTVRVLIRGRTTDIPGSVRFGETKKLVYTFTLGR